MATFKVLKNDSHRMEVCKLNSEEQIVLRFVNNTGTEYVALYDENDTIWCFEGGPYKPSDFKVGKEYILDQVIEKPKE